MELECAGECTGSRPRGTRHRPALAQVLPPRVPRVGGRGPQHRADPGGPAGTAGGPPVATGWGQEAGRLPRLLPRGQQWGPGCVPVCILVRAASCVGIDPCLPYHALVGFGLAVLCCEVPGARFPFRRTPSLESAHPPSPLQTVTGEVKSRTQGLPRTAAARAVGRAVVAPVTPSTSGRCWSATRPACVVLRPWRLGCRRTVGPPVTHPSGRNGGTPYAAQVLVQV